MKTNAERKTEVASTRKEPVEARYELMIRYLVSSVYKADMKDKGFKKKNCKFCQ
jgi:hypothetical protein